MKVGIVILNYNDYENTNNFVNLIKNYKCLNEIIIVDNNSSDNSYELLKKLESKHVTILKNETNSGYGAGNNIGLRYLKDKCDIVMISNPDIEVQEAVINNIIQTFEENKEIAVLAPTIYELGKISKGWKVPTFWNDLFENLMFLHRFSSNIFGYKENHYQGELTEVEVVKGCFFAIRYDIFEKVGFFDENTFLYYEENILGKKLKDEKKKTYILNQEEVVHALSQSVNKSLNSLKKYKILKTSQLYYQKHYNHLNIVGRAILICAWKISYFGSYIYLKLRGVK